MNRQQRIHNLVSGLRQVTMYIVYVNSPMQRTATLNAIERELNDLDGYCTVTKGERDTVTLIHVRQLNGKVMTAIIEVHMTTIQVVDIREDLSL